MRRSGWRGGGGEGDVFLRAVLVMKTYVLFAVWLSSP